MSAVKVELNSKGIEELLTSSWAEELVQDVASGVASRAGSGYAASTHITDGRAHGRGGYTDKRVIANVYPDTKEAAQDNYEHNTLLKAIGG